ncbi:MAG: FAD-dependent oxidoreductase [Deltaproteobacteria bacterium]|nr:FAD-dependent oxidoreductase [Deltaproteobacteria bacterium]
MEKKHIERKNLSIAPCKAACPAGIDVPRYIRHIRKDEFDEALAVIREKIPFPAICGYACYSPCELNCISQHFGDPIAIRALKRTAAEMGGELWKINLSIAPATQKKVAIVGSGPSGLTAGYYLATLGHEVNVYEALDVPGGMMRVGIPAYRLPREALDQEIEDIKAIGVGIQTGQRVESADALLKKGYDAVYLACGVHQGMTLGIPGDDLPGVVDGISFLRKVNAGEPVDMQGRVAIVGGGNTAVDAARSAIRLGVKEVTVVYRRTDAEMTAWEEEVNSALLEGATINYLTIPTQVTATDGGLEVTFTRMELGEPDDSGRPRPIPIAGSEFNQVFDHVIAAIGQMPVGTQAMGIALAKGDFIQVDPETLATDTPGVFAGGDIVTGPASIIDAIAYGRGAAISIDRHLGGSGIIDQELTTPEKEVLVEDYAAETESRQPIPCIPRADRTCSFETVELGFTEASALAEASRCRDCDARQFEVALFGDGCKECSYCTEVCSQEVFGPADSFNEKGYRPMEVKHQERCVGCQLCFYACPDFSIDVREVS